MQRQNRKFMLLITEGSRIARPFFMFKRDKVFNLEKGKEFQKIKISKKSIPGLLTIILFKFFFS